MIWLMNVNGDIWSQDTQTPIKMIETNRSEIPETIDFWNSQSVTMQFPVSKTINDINKEMIESALENQQTSNTKTKGERE
jgi:t-SNARE complex subunit (syntaxin)